MLKHRVSSPADALAYLTDCTLATVTDMASKKSRPKFEFERQISIASTGIAWMLDFGVDLAGTRAEGALLAGGVKLWAEQFMPEVRDAA